MTNVGYKTKSKIETKLLFKELINSRKQICLLQFHKAGMFKEQTHKFNTETSPIVA